MSVTTETPMQGDQELSTYVASDEDAGASLTYPMQASKLAKGDFIVIKGHPCKITAKHTSKPGKHGHAKVNFEANCLFTSQKYTDVNPTHAVVSVPVVTVKSYILLNLSEGYLSLLDPQTKEMREDVRVSMESEVGSKLAALWSKEGEKDIWVTVLAAMGREIVEMIKEVEA